MFLVTKIWSSLPTFYRSHHAVLNRNTCVKYYQEYDSLIVITISFFFFFFFLFLLYYNLILVSFMTYQPFYFQWGLHCSILVFWMVLCRSLYVLLISIFWSLYCLSFFELRLLITLFDIIKLLLRRH